MNKYKNLHLWLFVPFVIVMLGFSRSYWLNFFNAPWRQHLHGITATLWFIILIAQPYLISRGNVKRHRSFGLLALFLAGALVFSSLGAIPYNLSSETMPDIAKYGLSFMDVLLISGFSFAVFMAIKNVHNTYDHARWMISTVFWALGPGLIRFFWTSADLLLPPDTLPGFFAIPLTGFLIGLTLLILMIKDRKAHLAYLLALFSTPVYFALPLVGKAEWWINLANALFTL